MKMNIPSIEDINNRIKDCEENMLNKLADLIKEERLVKKVYRRWYFRNSNIRRILLTKQRVNVNRSPLSNKHYILSLQYSF